MWNFTRLKHPKVNPTYANLTKQFNAFQTAAKRTIVNFDPPNPFVVDALPNLAIIDPASFQQYGANKPVGTGPFTFVEYVQADHLTPRTIGTPASQTSTNWISASLPIHRR